MPTSTRSKVLQFFSLDPSNPQAFRPKRFLESLDRPQLQTHQPAWLQN